MSGGFTSDELAPLHRVFLVEAGEHLDAIEGALAELDAGEDPGDSLARLLRVAHTLKGSAGSVELESVAQAAHRFEDQLVALRERGRSPSPDERAALRSAVDGLRAQLRSVAAGTDGAGDTPGAAPARRGDGPADRRSGGSDRRRAGAVDDGASERDRRGGGGATLIRVEVERIDELLDATGELVIDRTRLERRRHELAAAVRELAEVRALLRRATAARAPVGATPAPAVRTADARALPDGAALYPAAAPGGGALTRAGAHQRTLPDDAAPAVARADELADGDALAGAGAPAAVLADASMAVSGAVVALERVVAAFGDDLAALRQTSQVLRDGVQRVRLVRVGRLFARLAVPLRDLARRAGREVTLLTDGEETEIDKAVGERLADPLLHLVRNAVAHGIEPPAARIAAGKPRAGEVRLGARQRGATVLLTVADDGAGIDLAAVRAALVRDGRLDAGAAARASDEELLAAIFTGVSTRATADDLAGRGVGLDAVRDAVVRLGGEIACRSSPARGTTFTVRLPLTTAVAQALLFKVGGQVCMRCRRRAWWRRRRCGRRRWCRRRSPPAAWRPSRSAEGDCPWSASGRSSARRRPPTTPAAARWWCSITRAIASPSRATS